MYEPIAIIGYGVLYPPNSDNVQNFWKNIKNGVQGIREVTNEVWNVNDYYNEDENVPDKTYCKNSAYLDNTGSLMDYISKFNLDDGKILSLNRTKKMVLYTILQAIDEANLNINELRDSSLIIGNMLGDLDISDYMLYKFGKNYLNEVEKSSLVQRGSLEKITDKFGSRLYEELDLEDRNIDGMFPIEAAAELADLYLNNFGMKEYKVAEISEFEFEKFIKVYEDREVELTLTGEILLKSDNQLVMKVTLSSDFVNSKGVVLQKNIIHSSGIIEMNNLLTTESVERYRDMLGKYNSIQIKKHLNMDKYYLKGADNIFFGPNFRNISNVRVDNSKKISIGDINVTDESKVFNFINNIDSKINPILIDNVGRLMLLNEFYQNGNTVVPTFISKTISLESFNIGEKVKAYVEKVAENGDEVIYDAFVFNESKLLLIIEQMHLTKVGQTSDYEIEI